MSASLAQAATALSVAISKLSADASEKSQPHPHASTDADEDIKPDADPSWGCNRDGGGNAEVLGRQQCKK